MATHRPQPECREKTRSLLSTSATAAVARRLADKAMPISRHPAQLLRHLPLRVQQLHSRQHLHQRPRLQLPPRLHLLQRLLEVPHLLQPQRLLLPRLRQRLRDLARQRGRARYRGLAQHRHPARRRSRKPLGGRLASGTPEAAAATKGGSTHWENHCLRTIRFSFAGFRAAAKISRIFFTSLVKA